MRHVALILGLLTWLVIGCAGSDKPKYAVSGSVTFDGVPVEEGDILFVPAAKDTAAEGGKIEDGTYHFMATAGAKRVEIRAAKLNPKIKNPKGEPTPVDYIPPQFNLKSNLTADVRADGANQFDFNLKSR